MGTIAELLPILSYIFIILLQSCCGLRLVYEWEEFKKAKEAFDNSEDRQALCNFVVPFMFSTIEDIIMFVIMLYLKANKADGVYSVEFFLFIIIKHYFV